MMTSVVRYVKNTTTAANVNVAVASTGGDYQLVAFDITTAAGIAANANANILTWIGAGKIKSILSVFVRAAGQGAVAQTGEVIPFGAVAQNTHSTITLDATGRTINIALLAGAPPINAGATISLLLVIGNY
jgi:hypothetical protein